MARSVPTSRPAAVPPLVVAAGLMLTLVAGCGGQEDGQARDTAAPAAPAPSATAAPPALDDAQKAAIVAALPAPYDQGDLENGRRAFARCRSCHTVTEGGPNMTGPNLWGLFGRQVASQPRYNYSNALKAETFAWDAERLDHWLQNPKTFLPGNKMAFAGLPDATDRRDVIAWLKVETGYGR